MASSGGAGAGEQPAVAMDARLLMATGREDCERLKDLVNKKDATKMVVVLVSSKEPPAAEPTAPPPAMNPLLLASACAGSWKAMKSFLMEDAPMLLPSAEFQALVMSSDSARKGASASGSTDVEHGGDDGVVPAAGAASLLLQGVTVDGDTALHVVASHGDGRSFLECAENIHKISADLVLFKQNSRGDTPLHCAARAGKSQMVGCLLGLADRVGQQQFVRTENAHHETALHDAVRLGNKEIVEKLMAADPELARFPEHGVSPLYLAILLEYGGIAETLHDKSKGNLSYSGPDGQNALHAAVLRQRTVFTKLLRWNKDLTERVDEKGSTPLHFAAALHYRLQCCKQLLDANIGALYQPDKDGLFPIHVAASVGGWGTIKTFLKVSPSIADLRDAKGRTFLHVAVEKRKTMMVWWACMGRSLTWIMNMQDNDGNTALHLAVQARSLLIFCALYCHSQVHLSLINQKGQTPLDISQEQIPPGMFYTQNTECKIRRALEIARAQSGGRRHDYLEENDKRTPKPGSEEEKKEIEKVKDATQTFCITSVLIATVTFGATFAPPGGFRADDHILPGTPTLSGTYLFDAFMRANALAFIASSTAMVFLMYSGTPMVNLASRRRYAGLAFTFMHYAVLTLFAAFALAAYSMLPPDAHKTAVAICVISPLVVICAFAEFWVKSVFLTPFFIIRKGIVWTLVWWTGLIVTNAIIALSPFVFIFGWAKNAKTGLPAVAPAPAPFH